MGSLLWATLFLLFSNLVQLNAYGRSPNSEAAGSSPQDMEMEKKSLKTETRFLLLSSENGDSCQIQLHHLDTLDKCSFNSSLPLVIIVHGWSVDGMLEKWIWKMAAALQSQKSNQVNVIVADWIALAYQHYAIAVRNTRRVGQEIADFLEWLEEAVQFSRSNVHLIGYSLGAHVSGFAGSYINGTNKIGRITGLDPAGPLFEGTSPTERLSPDDADFVDAIHTFTQEHMGLSVGIKQPVAHYDFYPNGGTFQPGCHFLLMYRHIAQHGFHGITETVKCAHERSVHLFIDSILHDHLQSTAYWCSDMNTFNKGLCLDCKKGRCNTLGYHIRKQRQQKSKKLFLVTQAHTPFKVYHYQFKIQFVTQTEKPIEPTFTMTLIGTKQDTHNLPITLVEEITGNKTYSFLITLDLDIGELTMINFTWKKTAMWANVWATFHTIIPWATGPHHPQLMIKQIRVKAGETQKKMTFCSQDMDDIQLYRNQEKTFVRCEKDSKTRKQKLR
ncbi:hepatic triacylglycerol lipase [Vombatus ursinus]|uniref:Hepatic triacylglycerol lipase n=1 Tax=Vombatus ursinus TaxID=29139 RepID=A0A4X2LRQ6_VOMUR|nr:hepatic triacylglycerol lipase [Vombatus ursinus]